jgi:RecA/RadA recombinase
MSKDIDKDILASLNALDDVVPYSAYLSDSTLSSVNDWIDTGSMVLNALISGSLYGGIPNGRITQLAGPSGAFKTGLVMQILANAQKKGMIPVIFDTEGAIDPESAAKFGLDITKVKYVGCESVEQTRNAIYKFLKNVREKKQFGKFIIAIDSLANLNSEMELTRMDKDSMSADMGTFAKSVKSLLKTCTNMSTLTKTPILITNHVYDDPSAMYPSLEKNMPGGKAAVYLPSVTIQLARKLVKDADNKQVNDKLAASQKNYSGVVIRALTVKNRFIKQYLEGEFYLSFSKGLDKYYGLLDIMKGMGVVDNSGSSYTDWTGEKLGYYKVWSKDIDLWENKFLPELEKRIKEHWAYGSSPDDDNLVELEEDENINSD